MFVKKCYIIIWGKSSLILKIILKQMDLIFYGFKITVIEDLKVFIYSHVICIICVKTYLKKMHPE